MTKIPSAIPPVDFLITDLPATSVDAAISFDRNSDDWLQPEEKKLLEAKPGQTLTLVEPKARTTKVTHRRPEWSEPVQYADFPDLPWSQLSREKRSVPAGLAKVLPGPANVFSAVKVADPLALEKMIIASAEARGVQANELARLTAKQAVELAVNIVADRLTYLLVDEDQQFIDRYGKHLPIDRYLQIGRGDCDKYAAGVEVVFSYLKTQNPGLANVHVSRASLGGLTQAHAWNTVLLVGDGGIAVSHIDPTFNDNQGNLIAQRGFHVSKNQKEFVARFYADSWAFNAAYLANEELYRDAVKGAGQTNDAAFRQRQEDILVDMAYLGYQLADPRILASVRARHEKLFAGPEKGQARSGDSILFYSAATELKARNLANAEKFAARLRQEYPKHFRLRALEDQLATAKRQS